MTTNDPTFMIKGLDYDCLGIDIQCVADRDGATLFEIATDVPGRVLRVLSHDEFSAIEGAKDKMPKFFMDDEVEDEDEE